MPAMSSTSSFLDRWYDSAAAARIPTQPATTKPVNYSGVEELRGCASCGRNGGKWPWEQAVLSRLLLDGDATLRARVRLLIDPGVYNGPGGHMVRHLYGTWRNKRRHRHGAHVHGGDTPPCAHRPYDIATVHSGL